MAETNRVEKWELNEITCPLCGEHIGYAEGWPDVWCAQCAIQTEDEDEL